MSVLPTLRKMWTRIGQQVMIPTPGQARRAYGIGAVNDHTGATGLLTRTHTGKPDIAELLRALLAQHPSGPMFLVLDNSPTHFGGPIDEVVRDADGRLVLLYLPTYSPWLNPIEMRWRSMRYAVTHGALFPSLAALEAAFVDYFATLPPSTVCSILGSTTK